MKVREEIMVFLRSRRSIREFQDREVTEQDLQTLLEAATLAPSAHNLQHWRFAVIQDRTKTQELAQALAVRLEQDRLRDGYPVDEIRREVDRSLTRLTNAPVVILVCLTMKDADQYPDDHRKSAEHQMAVQSTAMAGENLLLAAQGIGLGACWICAPLFAPDVIHTVLELPADWEPQGLILVGHPLDVSKPRERKDMKEVSLWI